MASMRLLCFAFAGGGASVFRNWSALLPESVEVYAGQLPGREDRLSETPFSAWKPMMESMVDAVSGLHKLRTAIFGHSLGAVIGLELARWMHASQPKCLAHLFVAGRAWPGDQVDKRFDSRDLTDDDLLEALNRQYGSMPLSLSHPEIRDLVLPVLRADLRLLETYEYASAPPLECPLTVFGGIRDPATNPENLAAWKRETRGAFRLRMLDGEHFFLATQKAQLTSDIAISLARSIG